MSDILQLYQISLPIMVAGLFVTVQICALSLLLGGIVGTLLGTVNSDAMRPKWIGGLIDAYVGLMRGTPLFVQVLIAYFGLPTLTGVELSPLEAGIIALGLNSAAYLSEMIRGGINAIPKGQWKACQSLGYSKAQTMWYIILPQAAWNVAPGIVNEMISLIKESSILLVVGVPELTKVSKDLVSYQLKPMEIYLLSAALYLLLTSSLHFLGRLIERKKPWTC